MGYPFRIETHAEKQARARQITAQGEEGAGKNELASQYAEKLLKLIPADVVALYQSVYGIVLEQTDTLAKTTLRILPIIGFILVIFVRAWGTRNDNGEWKSVQVGAVAIAAVSFVVWVISLGHPIIGVMPLPQWLGSVLLIIWVFLVPYFYKAE
jgi:hypothetical protein